jgi:GNAT superfamily N-acetyltransferase
MHVPAAATPGLLRRLGAGPMWPAMLQNEPIRVETRSGAALLPLLPALARLRTAVFRAWPYLYDGDAKQESAHLAEFAASPRAGIVIAFAGDEPVGASTCLPMADESDNVKAPFLAHNIAPERVFYFGESVLLPGLRGQGIGVRFFEAREAHARAVSDADFACFCSVERSPDDPRRPPGWVPLDAFWRKRGYRPMPGFACTMEWREVGHAEETPHRLNFWGRALRDAALP